MSAELQVPEKFQYLKPGQVSRMESEIKGMREELQRPVPGGADRGEMGRRIRRMEATLDSQKAPDLNPEQRDYFAKEAKRLEADFVPGMLSGEEMRKNPAGAVGYQVNESRRTAKTVFRWKNIMRLLNPHDDSPDLSNIERFRQHTRTGQFGMHDVQIPGKTYIGTNPTPEYKEGWDRTFGDGEPVATANDVLALREELEELKGLIASQETLPKPTRRSKQKAMPCGAVKAIQGEKMHVRHCDECKEILASAATTVEASPAA